MTSTDKPTTDKPVAAPKKGPVSVGRLSKTLRSYLRAGPPAGADATLRPTRGKSANMVLEGTQIRVTGLRKPDRRGTIRKIRLGMQYSSVERLMEDLRVNQKEIAHLLSIPSSTLKRRRDAGRLQPDESDRVVRFARLRDASTALMQGNEEAAVNWLHTPIDALDHETPLEHATTELGAKDVEDLIGRLRHGVFS